MTDTLDFPLLNEYFQSHTIPIGLDNSIYLKPSTENHVLFERIKVIINGITNKWWDHCPQVTNPFNTLVFPIASSEGSFIIGGLDYDENNQIKQLMIPTDYAQQRILQDNRGSNIANAFIDVQNFLLIVYDYQKALVALEKEMKSNAQYIEQVLYIHKEDKRQLDRLQNIVTFGHTLANGAVQWMELYARICFSELISAFGGEENGRGGKWTPLPPTILEPLQILKDEYEFILNDYVLYRRYVVLPGHFKPRITGMSSFISSTYVDELRVTIPVVSNISISKNIESNLSNALFEPPSLPPPNGGLYHEKQTNKDCAIHAFNNAVQYSAITNAMCDEEVETLVSRWVQSRKPSKPPYTPQQIQAWRNSLTTNGTMYSASVIRNVAEKLGYWFQDIPLSKFSSIEDKGSYYLIGVSTLPKSKKQYPHSIAVFQKKFIDSEYDKVFLGPPWHFKTHMMFKIVPLKDKVTLDTSIIDVEDDQLPYSPSPQPPFENDNGYLSENQITEETTTRVLTPQFVSSPTSNSPEMTSSTKKRFEQFMEAPKSKKAAALNAIRIGLEDKSIPAMVQSTPMRRSMAPPKQREPRAVRFKSAVNPMGNPWVRHVKIWAQKHNTSYACAVTNPDCRSAYKRPSHIAFK
jgi:hypothetical protein